MPGNDATRRQNERFLRNPPRGGDDPNLFARLAERNRRATPETAPGGRSTSPNRTRVLYPVRTGGRATLVERDNPQEFLEFHWDPTTYDVNKSAKWTENAVEGGTSTLSYSGCTPLTVTFELFLNEIGQPHKNQRSVEDSIAWLMNRLRPRTTKDAARRGLDEGGLYRGRKWLNVRDPEAREPPPILILFGLRDGFYCVLADVKVKTEFQSPPKPLEEYGFSTTEAAQIRQGLTPSTRLGQLSGGPTVPGARAAAEATTRMIQRARVGITLREYTNAPATGSGS